jgi:hypothetical protein
VSGPPWVFRYVEDPADETARKLDQPPPFRPVVAVRLIGREESFRVAALVDSGSERTLAQPGLAREIGIDLSAAPETEIGIGGRWRKVRFAEVVVELYASILEDDEPALASWSAEVGFFNSWEPAWGVVLGGTGFFDKFTVTMHRGVPALAIDRWEEFDDRYGRLVEEADNAQPRFRP